ncbi:hypothetical protein [Pontiella sulfatireligans]|uniref:hypothetical protein n=1 Tax=Pontiella sulfatireligans TaxID=2750658 RepID=UPI00109CBD6C|nr:hypothetical protein [Pontiella sulfatireligans]
MESNEYSGHFCKNGSRLQSLASPAHGWQFPIKQQPFQSIGFVALHTVVAEDFPVAGTKELKITTVTIKIYVKPYN